MDLRMEMISSFGRLNWAERASGVVVIERTEAVVMLEGLVDVDVDVEVMP